MLVLLFSIHVVEVQYRMPLVFWVEVVNKRCVRQVVFDVVTRQAAASQQGIHQPDVCCSPLVEVYAGVRM